MTPTASGPAGPPAPVVRALRCSVCGDELRPGGRTLRCPRGHAFDLARQGYVNLLHAKVPTGTADTADMVAARAAFLAAGHYAPVAERIAELAARLTRSGLIVDAGAGTGYYLARVLDQLPAATGLALDVSALALRRAARAHDRLGAAVWNLWQPWPVADGAASLLLNVFAPRNGPEFHRVLRPGGGLVVVSPRPEHLRELASVVDLLEVDDRKQERIDATLGGYFEPVAREQCTRTLTLTPEQVRQVVGMGPNAHHPGRLNRLDRLDGPRQATLSVTIAAYRRVP